MEVERVQAIALKSKTIDTIPSEFVQTTEQLTITTELEVPTIDLGDQDESKVVDLIAKASKEWGLFQVVNHGIPNEAIAKLQDVGKQFFELPQEEKEAYATPVDGGVYKGGEGYGGQLRADNNNNNKKGWNDHLFHKIWPPSAIDYLFWPKNPPSYREANEEYAKHLRGVTDKLLKCLSKGLGIEDGALKEGGGGDELIYLMKINYYPPCPRPDLAFGVLPHTDMSLLTILVPNDVPGLQVCRDGVWYDVRYIPNALIIHIGDQIEIMSNGEYKAVFHRTTVNKDKTRMSWPVFIEPPADHAVGPIPKLVSEEKPAKFKTKKFSDYKYCKLNKLPM